MVQNQKYVGLKPKIYRSGIIIKINLKSRIVLSSPLGHQHVAAGHAARRVCGPEVSAAARRSSAALVRAGGGAARAVKRHGPARRRTGGAA
jgi:hypothetical protein